MGIETDVLLIKDPQVELNRQMLVSNIDARDVVRTRNVLISRELTLLEAESFVRAIVHPNRTVTNLSNRYNVADNTLFNNASERRSQIGNSTYNLIKETRIDSINPSNAIIRVRVEAKSTIFLDGFIQFRRNGIAVSGEIVLYNTFSSLTFDIPNVVVNDLLQIWGRVSPGFTRDSVVARNFVIGGNVTPIPSLIEAVRIGSAGLPTPLSATSLL